MIAAPMSARSSSRAFGTKLVVAAGLLTVAAALLLLSDGDRPRRATGSSLPCCVIVGVGMGLAMAPATDSIMGSLPAGARPASARR